MSSGRFSLFIVPGQKDGSFFAVKCGIKGADCYFCIGFVQEQPLLTAFLDRKSQRENFWKIAERRRQNKTAPDWPGRLCVWLTIGLVILCKIILVPV